MPRHFLCDDDLAPAEAGVVHLAESRRHANQAWSAGLLERAA